MALKKMGQSKVPVIYQEFESEAQLYAYMVSDNAIGKDTWAEIDLNLINDEILNFGPEFDIEMLGLKEFSIEPLENKFEMEEELRDDMNKKFIIEVTFPNDCEMMDIHDDLVSRGYIVKIK